MKNKKDQKRIRHARVTAKIISNGLPRLVVFRSNKFIYAQIIDDKQKKTLASASDIKMKSQKESKIEKAKKTGKSLAGLALKKNIKKVVFDRAGYKYHGRIRALAEGAREGGLVF